MKPWPDKSLPRRTWIVVLALGSSMTGVGCPTRELGTVSPIVQSGTKIIIEQPRSHAVDLLVMVDNSSSMAEEQGNLTQNFQVLLDSLTSARPDDPNGRPLVGDLHVGVVSSDMGTGGYPVTTCSPSATGDDGVLLHAPSASPDLSCESEYPEFLAFDENADPAVMSNDFSCIAALGTDGCGFEQQLKAVRKALTTHAAGANAGFLRDDSLLAILLVTDEEDCSVKEGDPAASDIFDLNRNLGPQNLRCFTHRAQYVEPVSRYVDDILALRADDPGRLVVAAIVGIPPTDQNPCNLTGMTDADFDCLLSLPQMDEIIDNSADGRGQRLTPSCNTSQGEAYPPRRIVDFVRGVAATTHSGIVRSICDQDFQPAMQAITNLIAERLDDACLARTLEVDEDGQVECIVQETLDSTDACGPGRIDRGLSGGHRVCQVCQEGDGVTRMEDELGTKLGVCTASQASGDFWSYEEADDERCSTARVVFRGESVPADGSTVYFECLSQI